MHTFVHGRLTAVLTLGLLGSVAGCLQEVAPSNPYDPALPVEQQQRATLEGVVSGRALIDPSSVTALAGATISIEGPSNPINNPATTVEDGRFNFGELIPGRYTLEVWHPAYLRQIRDLVLEAGETRALTVSLDPIPDGGAPDAAHITGTAQKASELALEQTLQDHSGIVVEVGDAGVRTVTNAAGRFDLFLSGGTYDLSFSATDHIARSDVRVSAAAGETTVLPEVVTLLANPGSVTGTVELEGAGVDMHGDTLVSLVGGESSTTNPDGSFVISDVPAGTYALRAIRDGYDTVEIGAVVVHGGRQTQVANMTLPISRGRITGQVELQGRSDFSGVAVGLTGTAFGTTTNASGGFALESVPVGSYELSASKDGFSKVVVGSVTVSASATTNVGLLNLTKQLGDFAIDGGADYTNDTNRNVTLQLEPPAGNDEINIYGDVEGRAATLDPADWQAFDPQIDPVVQLSDGDGLKVVRLRFRDGTSGVESSELSASITLDREAPSWSSVQTPLGIDGGSAYSKSTQGLVTLAFEVGDALSGVSHLRVSNDGVFDSESWQPFVAALTHTLADPSTEGAKTVSVQFRDFAGNVTNTDCSGPTDASTCEATPNCSWAAGSSSCTNRAAVSIILDYTPPTLIEATVKCPDEPEAGAPSGFCNERSAVVRVSASDDFDPSASGATWIALANEEGFLVDDFDPFIGIKVWQLSPTDGDKTIYIKLRDAAGNVTSEIQRTITLDTVAPTGLSVIISGTAAAGSSTSVTRLRTVDLALAATDANLGLMRISNSSDFSGFTAQSFDASYTGWTLADADGRADVYLEVIDQAGNVASASGSIVLDRQAPTLYTVRFREGTVSDAAAVTLEVQGEGAAAMRIGGDVTDTFADTWITLASTAAVTLDTASQGNKTVAVTLRDEAGNTSSTESATITYDDQGPLGATLVIDGGASHTGDRVVTLDVSPGTDTTGVTGMAVVNGSSPSCAAQVYGSFVSTTSWTLPNSSGELFVSVCLQDVAGNTSSVTSSIVLDTTAPSIAGATVAGGSAYTTTRTVSVALSASDDLSSTASCPGAGCELEEQVSTDPLPDEGDWLDYGSTADLVLADQDGEHTVYFWVRDRAGNVTGEAATIVLDRQAPLLSGVTLTSGTTVGNALYADGISGHTLSISAQDAGSGLSEMAFVVQTMGAEACGSAPATWETFALTRSSFTLNDSSGAQWICAWVRDAAGKVAGPVVEEVIVDRGAPTTAAFAVVLGGTPQSGACTTVAPHWTRSTSLTIDLSGSDDVGIAELQLSEDSSFGDATWQPWSTQTSFNMRSEEGEHTIYMRVRDSVGNVLSAGIGSVCVTLDTLAPTALSLTSMAATGGYDSTGSTTFFVTGYDAGVDEVTPGDDGTTGLTLMIAGTSVGLVGVDGVAPTGTLAWPAGYQVTASWDTAVEGTKKLILRARDPAGNVSAPFEASVIYDDTAPAQPTLTFVEPGNKSAELSWEAVSDANGISHYEVFYKEGAAPSEADHDGVVTSIAAQTSVTGLENTFTHHFAVRAVDAAGNASALSASRDAAVGWVVRPVASSFVRYLMPQDIAYHDGVIYVLFHEQTYVPITPPMGTPILQPAALLKLATSTDGGESWRTVEVADGGAPYGDGQAGPMPGRVRSRMTVGRAGISVVTVDWYLGADDSGAGQEYCPSGATCVNLVELTSEDGGSSWRRSIIEERIGDASRGAFALGMSKRGTSRVVMYNAHQRTAGPTWDFDVGAGFAVRYTRKADDLGSTSWNTPASQSGSAADSYSMCNANYVDRVAASGMLVIADLGEVHASTSTDHGGSYGAPVELSTSPQFTWASVACTSLNDVEWFYFLGLTDDHELLIHGQQNEAPFDTADLVLADFDADATPDADFDGTAPVAAYGAGRRLFVAYPTLSGELAVAVNDDASLTFLPTPPSTLPEWRKNIVDASGNAGYNPVITGYEEGSIVIAYSDLQGTEIRIARSALLSPQGEPSISEGLATYSWSTTPGAASYEVSASATCGGGASSSITGATSYTFTGDKMCLRVAARDEFGQRGDTGSKWEAAPFVRSSLLLECDYADAACLETGRTLVSASGANTGIGAVSGYVAVLQGHSEWVKVQISEDGGETFPVSRLVYDKSGVAPVPYRDVAMTLHDPGNDGATSGDIVYVHVVWQTVATNEEVAYVRGTHTVGTPGWTWSAPKTIASTGVGDADIGEQVTVHGEKADVVVAYADQDGKRVFTRRSVDHGGSFFTLGPGAGNLAGIAAEADWDGEIHPMVGGIAGGTQLVYWNDYTYYFGKLVGGDVMLARSRSDGTYDPADLFTVCDGPETSSFTRHCTTPQRLAGAKNAQYVLLAMADIDNHGSISSAPMPPPARVRVSVTGEGSSGLGPVSGLETEWTTFNLETSFSTLVADSLQMVGSDHGAWLAYAGCKTLGLTTFYELRLAYCAKDCHSPEAWVVSPVHNATDNTGVCDKPWYQGLGLAVDPVGDEIYLVFTEPQPTGQRARVLLKEGVIRRAAFSE